MLPYNTCSAASSRNGGGILRKTGVIVPPNNVIAGDARKGEMLLVFGYASKIFRDDAKAKEIDQGKHLIPWMGDPNLKIDRYDVRGALSDLAPHEPPPGGYGNRLDYLTAEEQRAEQLCEEERYFFLYNNEEELILQQEEDMKRLQQEAYGSSYSRVEFQYDSPLHGPNMNEDDQQSDMANGSDDSEEPYVMPKTLQVPISIQLPETMKQHAIIEKTARFIASQGVQMEILLKAKQSNNVQFEFLSQNGILNPYYKFVLNAIKNGTYPQEEAPKDKDASLPSGEATATESLEAKQHTKPIITVPTIKYKPSANCAYTQLISKIKGVPLPEFLNEDANTSASMSADSPTPTPILLQYNENTYIPATANAAEGENNSNSNSNSNAQEKGQESQVEILKNSSALALAQDYASDSETDEEAEKSKSPPKPEPILDFPTPDETLKNIIDKTVIYVLKNGRQFEETLRSKSEDRFRFLVPDNEYYPYYMYRITGDPNAASKEAKTRKAAAVAAALLSKKGITGPVSFSIKGNDQTALPPALPQEPSDDDDDEHLKKSEANATMNPQRSVPENVQKAIQLVESQLMARNAAVAVNPSGAAATQKSTTPSSSRSRFDLDYSAGSSSKSQIKSTKTELERNAIYEQQQQNRQKQLKKAEEKVKDKLTQIAREKLGGLISKDKQLQLERKRKAMAFLNQIKGSSSNPDEVLSNELRSADPKDENGNRSDSSESSVHSIPITSYGPGDDDDDPEDENKNSDKKNAPAEITNDQLDSNSKSIGPTVLLSDDDDVELISEQRPPRPITSRDRHRHREHKRNHISSLEERDDVKRRKRKISPQSDVSSCSSEKSLKYEKHRHSHHGHYSSRHDEETSYRSAHKSSKKSKKSVKSKKKKKKSSSARDRSPSTFSQVSRSSRHSKHSRHRSRSLSDSDDDTDSTTESQRYKLSLYELDERVTYTPPASPGRSSSRKHKTSSTRHRATRRSHN